MNQAVQQKKLEKINKMNIIQYESIKRVVKHQDKSRMENFQLNPRTLVTTTDKPNHIDLTNKNNKQDDIFGNHYTDDPVQEAFSNNKVNRSLLQYSLVPKKKYPWTMTQNQEIGWYSNQLNRTKSTVNHKVKNCEITTYAEDYLDMTKTNPFKKGKR